MITVVDCSVLWQSQHQSKNDPSTMEAKKIAMAHSCRELLPIIDMVTCLGDAVGLPKDLSTMYVSIHEDNARALILVEILPPLYMPQSRHCAIKAIWFHKEIVKSRIKLVKIEIVE